MEEKEAFSYRYSAKEQNEIRNIRDKYVYREPDKMERLRRLDASVTRTGSVVGLSVGIIGTLIMGGGMSLVMVAGEKWFIPGIVIGVLGICTAALSYPLYSWITKRKREKLAPEIIRLTDELLK